MTRPYRLALVLLLCAGCTAIPKSPAEDSPIQLPTMGWSSWNTYRVNISDSLIMAQADAMVETGLLEAGYNHINIDDGYFGGRDPLTGRLLIHPTRFPGGLARVVDHIHSLSLKAGIYSDAGRNTCGSFWDKDSIAVGVGLYGHDSQDADFFFRELGFDFIKVDFCGGNAPQNTDHLALDPRERYTAIRRAIDATGRKDVRLNVCRWDFPGVWVRDVATSWRISHDISDNWRSLRSIISQNLYLSAYAGGGHYNDMDMLEVGRSLSQEEDRTHFGLWCIMSSPLLIGCDLTTLRSETLHLLTNKDLIALDQDPLGLQAYVLEHEDGTYVLVKDLEERFGTRRAVALYNPTEEEKFIGVDFDRAELGGRVEVRDLFGQRDLGSMEGRLEVKVPAHGTRIFRLDGERRLERRRYEAETAYLSDYQELYNNLSFHTASYTPDPLCSGGMAVTLLGGRPTNDLQWRDVHSMEGGRYVLALRCLSPENRLIYLSVGGGPAKEIRVRANEDWQDVEVEVTLEKGVNTVRLCNDRGFMPDIDFMELSPIS